MICVWQVVMGDAVQKTGNLADAVTTAVGPPHNYSAHDATSASSSSADTPAPATAAGAVSSSNVAAPESQDVAESAAEATQQLTMTDEQVLFHVQNSKMSCFLRRNTHACYCIDGKMTGPFIHSPAVW